MGTINQRPLKGFVRFDGQGRVVAGSLILRRKMPKVGKWQEILGYECCNPTTTTTTTNVFNTTTTTTTAFCVTLGAASPFSVLGASTVTNTGTSVVIGDLGLSPGTSVTGFPPGIIVGTEHVTDTTAAAAQIAAQAAYTCLTGLTPTSVLGADIGSTLIMPGVYTFASSATITGPVTLNGGGDPNAYFVFIIPTTLTTATSASVVLTNSAQAGNIYWLVGTSATIGISTTMIGTIIADQSVTMNTSATLIGKAFALNAAITLDTNIVNTVPCTINPCTDISSTTTTTSTPLR